MSLLPALMAAASAFCALVAGVAAAAALARASRASRAGEAGGAKAHARDLFTAALITVWAALPGLWAVAQPERFDAGRYTRMTRSEQWPLEFGVLITGCNLVAALALAARLRGERRRRGSDQAIASAIEQWERERHHGGGSPQAGPSRPERSNRSLHRTRVQPTCSARGQVVRAGEFCRSAAEGTCWVFVEAFSYAKHHRSGAYRPYPAHGGSQRCLDAR